MARERAASGKGRDAMKGAKWLSWYAAGIAVVHLWGNTAAQWPELSFNCLHLALLGSFGFLAVRRTEPASEPGSTATSESAGDSPVSTANPWLMAGAALTFVGGAYLIFAEGPLHERGEIMTPWDTAVAAITVALALTLAWRTSGPVVPILVAISVSYIVLWGRYVDGVFHFRGLNLSRVLYRAYFTGEGLFGMIATISATYVFVFILFSSFLLKSGGGEFIIRATRALIGRFAGGTGYMSVLASGLMGTISGSAVANTVSTGSITIPLMKRAGFDAKFSAAVCVAGSTGGQVMPPIMGAGAFLMAQWTGHPYSAIVGVALLPALLYFASLIFHVQFEADRLGMRPSDRSAPASEPLVWREGAHVAIPIGLLVALLALGFSPTYAACWAMAAVVASSWLTRHHRMGWREVIGALALGTTTMVPTAILLLCTGLIIGALNMTGVSVAFSQLVVEWSGGHLLYALILIAFASLILGMGLPVTAAYVMLAAVAAHSLNEMGISLLAAHMIIFWLSQDSNVTPPVCLAAFAGAALAGAPPMATGWKSWQLSKALYVMPLLFAYTPLIDGSTGEKLWTAAFALAGLFAMTAGLSGYCFGRMRIGLRAGFLVLAGCLFWPEPIWNVGAAAALGIAVGGRRTR